jgi:nodulation protein E
MVLGEGAGIVVLERLDAAKARGATIYGKLAGAGMNSDADDLLRPNAASAAEAVRLALADGGIAPEAVTYINAHGTGTITNDITETEAVRKVFGSHADVLAMSSTKSMHGHALGGAGAIELVTTLLAIQYGFLPPTVNWKESDPLCDIDCVPNVSRPAEIEIALSNSFAFGGLNSVLCVTNPDYG